MTGSYSILPALIELGEFQYCANEGNMGDLLIDIATRQFFRRHHLPVRHESHHHVVYGGGGRFVPFYGSLEVQAAKLTSARVERCIILPHSFYQVDSFIHVLDEHHLVFCREQRSLEYCRSLNERAQFLPADDMALHFCPDYSPPPDPEERGAPHCLKPWAVSLMGKIRKAVQESSFPAFRENYWQRGAFLPRRGKEGALPAELVLGQDISDLWSGTGDGSPEQVFLIRGLLTVLSGLDIVISDRLHICIAGLFAGCRVYFLDNNYGKLSGVYRQSLLEHPRAHLLHHSEFSGLFPEIFSLVRK